LLALWVVLYLRISAPINRTLTAAADARQTPDKTRTLQHNWDRIIVPAPPWKTWPSSRSA
jgi:hypothetical protein